MVELSEEWIDKAQAKLANASKGKFFQTTEARLIPTFDRGDDAAAIDDGKSQYMSHFNPSVDSADIYSIITTFLPIKLNYPRTNNHQS